MDRVKNERGEITQTIQETIDVESRWCKRVACTDWAVKIGIDPSEEETRFPPLFCAFHEWRGNMIERKWEREGGTGELSTLNQICNADLLETELDLGIKKGRPGKAAGSDDLPNEALTEADLIN